MTAEPRLHVPASAAGTTSREYWPALDGVRGLAILLVVAGHAGLLIGPTGGQVGVTVFFVLSGFLITSIIAREQSIGSFSFVRFYKRRAARLFPALAVYLLAVGAIVAVFVGWAESWSASWPAALYSANYAEILGHDMAYNRHTWSLAVEEHFYLLWPALFVFFPSLRKARTLFLVVFGLLALRFAVAAFDDFWSYHGTFTNGYALMLGCALATAYRDKAPMRTPKHTAELAGVCLTLIGWISLTNSRLMDSMKLVEVGVWLPPIAAGLAALMVWDLVHRESPSIFTAQWLRHAGRISYGWYLWHAPFLFISVFNNTPEKRLFWVAATFVIAEVSWRLVERPILEKVRKEKVPA